jgi:dTDP-4-amino-4,6-dideoxygalactose transaminase
LVVHYFGFPIEEQVLNRMPEAEGLIRVEDYVQGSLTERALEPGSFGDYRVLAFHKVLPLPDSGLLIRRGDVPEPPNAPSLGPPRWGFFGRRLLAKTLKALSVALMGGAPRPLYRPLFDAAERAAGAGVPARMSSLTRRMLERTEVSQVVGRRRDNFRWLADALPPTSGVSLLRKDLPEGVCPLGLPVRVANRDRVLDHLIANRVYAPIHWRLPEAVGAAAFPEAAQLSAEEITLPVDQRYGRAEMDFVARTLLEGVRRGEKEGEG